LPKLASEFEVILINDGSKDSSWQVIQVLSGEHAWVHGINMMRNYGQHNALVCGMRIAKYDITVTMDDDYSIRRLRFQSFFFRSARDMMLFTAPRSNYRIPGGGMLSRA